MCHAQTNEQQEEGEHLAQQDGQGTQEFLLDCSAAEKGSVTCLGEEASQYKIHKKVQERF